MKSSSRQFFEKAFSTQTLFLLILVYLILIVYIKPAAYNAALLQSGFHTQNIYLFDPLWFECIIFQASPRTGIREQLFLTEVFAGIFEDGVLWILSITLLFRVIPSFNTIYSKRKVIIRLTCSALFFDILQTLATAFTLMVPDLMWTSKDLILICFLLKSGLYTTLGIIMAYIYRVYNC